jgi:hypothetical protein
MGQTKTRYSKKIEQKSKIKSQKMAIMGFLGVKHLMKWGLK